MFNTENQHLFDQMNENSQCSKLQLTICYKLQLVQLAVN